MKFGRQHQFITYLVLLFLTGSTILSMAGCGQNEEKLEPPQKESLLILNANEKYPNANDEMVYFVTEEGNVEQRSLDGVYQQTYSLGEEEPELLYVDNSEILWLDDSDWPKPCSIMRTPIKKTKSGQDLKVDETEKLLSLQGDNEPEGGSGGLCGKPGTVFANADYIVFVSDYSRKINVYDRKKKKKIFSKKSSLFSQYTISAVSAVCGDQIIFNTDMVSEKPAEEKYEFSIYRLGDKQARMIDSRCFSKAAYIADPARNKVYYQIREDQSIWEYDCQTEKKREAISEEELRVCYNKNGLVWDEAYFDDSLFVDGNRLYFVKDQKNPLIFSCDLTNSSQSFCYERELTEAVHNQTKYSESGSEGQRLAILEGKLLLYWSDAEADYYACLDIETKTGKLIGKSGWLFQVRDPEMIYFALFGAWEDPGTTGKRQEIKNSEKQTSDISPKTAKNLSYQEQLQLFCSQADQWMGTDAEDLLYQYYAVTDLDQNGKLELIASTDMQGTGMYTYSEYFQVAADGASLRKCRGEWDEGYSEPDIVDGIQTAYVDPNTGIHYYVTKDYVSSGGASDSYCWHGAIVLKNGMLTTRTFASMERTWNKKNSKLQNKYYKNIGGESKKISKKEYNPEKLAEKYFDGFQKKKVNISWVRFQKKRKKLSDQEILKKLTKSYEAFALTIE